VTGEPPPSALRRMAAEVRNRLILDNIRDAVVVTDASGVVTDWNEGAVRLFGWSAAEMIGRHYASRFPPLQRQFVAEEMARRLDGSDWDGEYQDLRKDGTPVWIDSRVRRIIDGEGRAIGIVGLSHDITDRRRAEAALREKDELNRAVLDSMAAHVAVLEPDGQIRAVNRAWREFTLATLPPGTPYPPSCDVGANYLAVCGADEQDPSGAAAAMRQGIREVISGVRARFEIEYACHSPTRKHWFHLSVTPLQGGKGGCVVAHMDVTARKLAEFEVSGQADMLLMALSAARMGVWELDMESRMITATLGSHALLDQIVVPAPLDDFLGLVRPDDVVEAWAELGRTCAEGRPFRREVRFVEPGGRRTWLAIHARVKEGEARDGGTGKIVIGTCQDVTERREAEDALRQAQAVAHVGDWAVDIGEGTLTGSEEACRIFGLGPGPHPSARIQALVHPSDRARFGEAWKACLTGAPLVVEHRLIVDGQARWVETRGRLEAGPHGELPRVVGVIQDITSRRQLEERLRQAQKMEAVGQLAGGVAHDFNNLLTVITGFTGMMLDAVGPEDPLHEQLTEIQSAGDQAAALTARLLAFSRRTIIEPKVLDLNDLTESTLKLLRRIIGEDITLVARFDPCLGKVEIDPAQFEQVIMNLAINARDAMRAGGKLTIETRDVVVEQAISNTYGEIAPGRYASLVMTDTGTGMSEEVLRHIFEPFFTTKGLGKGSGLGLAIVFGAVEQARGRIAVESELGRGTRFQILLPVTKARPSRMSAPAQKAPRGVETILLTEDEVGVRRLGRVALEAQGYTVIEAASGEEAIERASLHEGPIHLLVTDVVMPGMGGHELADAMVARRPGIRVLYMSGYIDDDVVRRGVTASADAFLQKPFTRATLAAKVREILNAPAAGEMTIPRTPGLLGFWGE